MRLFVHLPHQTLLDEPVTKVVAEAEDGSHCLLPHHVDFLAILVPGILTCETPDGQELFLAVDEGLLVKRGPDVFVSVRNAVRGTDLGGLRETVENQFRALTEAERKARAALARLELSLARRFVEFQSHA